jgi:RimJ/RimL family protein N-acetyltransferase
MPPERIELRDLVLRRWSATDADALVTAVRESLEHLRPWFPWAAESPTLSAERGFLGTTIGQWDAGKAFAYGIFDSAERALLGTIGLRRQAEDAWDVGYWLHVDHTGRGIATTAAATLTGVAMEHLRAERVEIHCDRANEASAKVATRLGYRLDRIEDDSELMLQSGKRMIWVLHRDAYPGSEAERRVTER